MLSIVCRCSRLHCPLPGTADSLAYTSTGLVTRGTVLRTFLVLDFALHVVDGVRRLHLQGDGLTRQGLHKDLHNCSLQQKDCCSAGALGMRRSKAGWGRRRNSVRVKCVVLTCTSAPRSSKERDRSERGALLPAGPPRTYALLLQIQKYFLRFEASVKLQSRHQRKVPTTVPL